jgi:hypothetical protein
MDSRIWKKTGVIKFIPGHSVVDQFINWSLTPQIMPALNISECSMQRWTPIDKRVTAGKEASYTAHMNWLFLTDH